MMRIEPFRADHLLSMRMSSIARSEIACVGVYALAQAYERHGGGFAALDARGEVAFCGGLQRVHAGYATLWAFYAENAGRSMMAGLLRRTREYIARQTYARVDAFVRAEFPAAARWAEACGLTFDARLADAAVGGGDLLIFRKVVA